MKILHLIYNFASGGAERFAVDLCNEQNRQGHDVSILCIQDVEYILGRSHYKSEISEGIHVMSVGCKDKLTPYVLVKILLMIHKINPEIIHAHTYPLPIYLPALLLRKKIVWTIHSVIPYYITNGISKNITKFLFLKKRIFPVTISKQCQKSFCDVYKEPLAKLIFNGRSEIALTSKSEEVKKEVLSLKQDENTPVFIQVARYSKVKNQNLLFKAFNQLHKDRIDFCLIVIGDYFNNQIKSKVEQCPKIHILGSKNNVGDYLNISDFFVLTSLFEGLPISLLEAMSKGCVPISTPAGGVVDVIKDGETGYISPSHSLEDYVATLKRALNDKSVTPSKVTSCYTNNYTMKVCANQYFKYYEDILK